MRRFSISSLFGYSWFFERFSYTRTNWILDRDISGCDTNYWFLGRYHLVISNERKFNVNNEKRKDRGQRVSESDKALRGVQEN